MSSEKKRGDALRLPSWVQTSPRGAPSLAEKGGKKSRLDPIGLSALDNPCLPPSPNDGMRIPSCIFHPSR
jgi:hypothetical protein